MMKNLTNLILITMMFAGFALLHWVAYTVGQQNGRRQMASFIPRIRNIERINALAPRNHNGQSKRGR